jgi:CRISPR-associated protein Cas1
MSETNASQPDRIQPSEVHHLKKKLPDLLPARMLNEFVYCPRLFYYEWVEGVFKSSADTLEGEAKHSRVDTEPGAMPTADEMGSEVIQSRSISLCSERVGLIAKLDLVESDPANGDNGSVRPVDYKKGRPREVDGALQPWPSDKIQIAAQVLVLRDNGYRCDEGILYYSATKQRVRVPIDDALVSETEEFIRRAKNAATTTKIP